MVGDGVSVDGSERVLAYSFYHVHVMGHVFVGDKPVYSGDFYSSDGRNVWVFARWPYWSLIVHGQQHLLACVIVGIIIIL